MPPRGSRQKGGRARMSSTSTRSASPRGENSAVVGRAPAILRWDVRTGKEAGRYALNEAGRAERHHLMVMHLTNDGRTVQAVSQVLNEKPYMNGLHAWDVTTGKR